MIAHSKRSKRSKKVENVSNSGSKGRRALPVLGPMMVVRSEVPSRVFSAAPTRLLVTSRGERKVSQKYQCKDCFGGSVI